MNVDLVRLLARLVESPNLLHDLSGQLGVLIAFGRTRGTHGRLDEVGNSQADILLNQVVDRRALWQIVSEVHDGVEESGERVVRRSIGRRRGSVVRGDAASTSGVAGNDD